MDLIRRVGMPPRQPGVIDPRRQPYPSVQQTNLDDDDTNEEDGLNKNDGNGNGHHNNGSIDTNDDSLTTNQQTIKTPRKKMQDQLESAKNLVHVHYQRIIIAFSIISFILLLIVIILAATLGSRKSLQFPLKCESESCLKAAFNVKSTIRERYDACDDFWSYSCSGWIDENKAPPYSGKYTVENKLRDDLNVKILHRISTISRAIRDGYKGKIIEFYEKCFDEQRLSYNKQTFLKQFIIKDLRGWAIINENDANKIKQNIVIEQLLVDYGVDTFFRIEFGKSDYHSTTNEIKLLPVELSLPSKEHYDDSNKRNGKYSEIQTKYKELIKDLTMDLAKEVNAADSQIAEDLADFVFKYEAKISKSIDDFNPANLKRLTLSQLKERIPDIEWRSLLQKFVEGSNHVISDSTTIIIYSDRYIDALASILTSTTKVDLNKYIIWRLTYKYAPYLHSEIIKAYQKFENVLNGIKDDTSEAKKERWQFCVELTSKIFGPALVHLLAENGDITDSSEAISLVGKSLIRELVQTNDLVWIANPVDRENIIKKIEQMTFAYTKTTRLPEKTLEDYYSTLQFPSTFVQMVKSGLKFVADKRISKGKVDTNTALSPIDPLTTDVLYEYASNLITINSALYSYPLFDSNNPLAVNYGSFAFLLASKMLRSVGPIGYYYPPQNSINVRVKMTPFVSQPTVESLERTISCFEYRIGHIINSTFSASRTLLSNVNPKKVASQTLLDVIAARTAFRAFRSHSREKGEEMPLPGLSRNNDQLFFISMAQASCETVRNGYARNFYSSLTTLPSQVRIEMIKKEMSQFSKTFMCPTDNEARCLN